MAKILLIEDDEAIITAYSDALTRAGYMIECVSNGRAGLEKVESFHPDLIMLDLFMPIFSGIEFLEALQQLPNHNLKIIVCSNALDSDTNSLVTSLGASAAILKAETSINELLEIVRQTLADLQKT